MVQRKSNTRKSAEKMARYKQRSDTSSQDSVEQGSRRSPRGRKSTSERNGQEYGNRSSQGGNGETSDKRKTCGNQVNNRALENAAEKTDIGVDLDIVIPETSPRSDQVGRKRVLASRPVHFGDDAEKDAYRSPDSQVPSKKRKFFNTPPRVGDGRGTPTPGQTNRSSKERALRPLLDSLGPCWDSQTMNDDDMQPPVPFLSKSREANTVWKARVESSAHEGNKYESLNDSPPRTFSSSVHDMDAVSMFSETLSTQLDQFKLQMKDAVSDMFKTNMCDVRETNKEISNAIRTKIGDFRNIINMMNSSNRPSSGKVATKTSLSEWEKTLDGLTPHQKLIFSKEVFARVLSYNVPVKAVDVYSQLRRKEPASPSVYFACSAFQVLLFS